MLRNLDQVLSDTACLSAVAVYWTTTIAVPVAIAATMGFGTRVVFELRSIKCGRVAVSRFEIAHKMTLVIQSHLVCDLFHTEKA